MLALAPVVLLAVGASARADPLGPRDAGPSSAHRTETVRSQDELADTRARFEAGDLVGTARCAADALERARTLRPQLMWYGARAALMLGDADAASAWIDALEREVGDSADWSETLAGFAARLDDLHERDRASRAALTRARAIGLGGMALLLACGLWAGWRRADD